MINISTIWHFFLRRGNSHDPRNGACLLDAVSWLEYGTLGDHPSCVCPVIAAFGRGINDAMSDDARQRLTVFIPRLVGTVDPAATSARAEYLAWQAIRVFAPIALDVAGLRDEATTLRNFTGTRRSAAKAAVKARDAAVEARNAAVLTRDVAVEVRAWLAAADSAFIAVDAVDATRAAGVAALAVAADSAADSAARAALAAARAAGGAAEAAMIAAFDGVLRIGRQAPPLDIVPAQAAVRAFELARS